MIRKILGLPVHLLRKLLGREKKKEAPAAAPPVRPPPVPRPPPQEEQDHGHDHGHSHSHGHSHDHGGHREEPEPEPVAHDHSHGHSHESPRKTLNILVEETPNPNARKFVCGVPVVEKGSLIFNSAAEAGANPTAKAIFGLGGVRSVFMVKDFVSVTREPAADWEKLAPQITNAIQQTLG